jgi:small subunit ribosomal protein S5
MTDTKEEKTKAQTVNTPANVSVKVNDSNAFSPKQALQRQRIQQRRKPKRKSDRSRRRDDDEFDSKIISIRRVTRVYKGGKRLRLSVVSVVGDKKGHVGIGVGKALDVKTAEGKAISYAKKHMITVPLKNQTIPHQMMYKFGAAKIFMKPASLGTGIIAGSSVRAVVELAGIKNILTKIIGTKNPINNAYATKNALSLLKQTRL